MVFDQECRIELYKVNGVHSVILLFSQQNTLLKYFPPYLNRYRIPSNVPFDQRI